MLPSYLIADTVHIVPGQHMLFLNSAAEPLVSLASQQLLTGTITLAEDNIAALHAARSAVQATTHTKPPINLRHVAFHDYTLREPAATIDVAIMNLLYQPNNAWMLHGLAIAAYALKPGGRLYLVGAKDRGILTMAKRMQALLGNVETLVISKGHRVVSSLVTVTPNTPHLAALARVGKPTKMSTPGPFEHTLSTDDIFAQGQLDEGTRLLLDALEGEVQPTDEALDMGCGAGYLGLHIARLAESGCVTMVDVSLLTVTVAQRNIDASGLTNIRVLPSDGTQAVLEQRFDLVVTNPPFHQGGLQTTTIAERFMREAAQILRPRGRFYLVANRFLKYEPTLRTYFKSVEEVEASNSNTRYKVLRAALPVVKSH